VVDSGGLENRCGRKSTQSSNLCPTDNINFQGYKIRNIEEASHSWLSAPVSKTGMVVRPSEVRTLPPPPMYSIRTFSFLIQEG
jgi:hypothetical protein